MTRRTLGMLSAVLVLAACSDDAAGPTGDRLTRAEAGVIAGNVTANSEQTAASPQMNVNGDASASDPISFSNDLEINVPCPVSGRLQQRWTARVNFDQEAGTFEMEVNGNQKHLACAFRHEGVTLTVDGDPDIDIEAHVATANHRPTVHTLSIEGAFKWSASDGRSGSCPITLDAVTNFAARTRTVEGDVCGHTIKETTNWSS
jgi:hypothetical protein